MTPKRVINTADVNRKQRQCYAKQIICEKAIIIILWSTTENVIKWRQAHADLKADEKSTDDQFIHEVSVNLQEGNVIDREGDEQKQSKYVRPYVNLNNNV